MKKVGIIGGGASGLMAALSAAKASKEAGQETKIIIFEQADRVGKKILATGNGRCNLTNMGAEKENYHGEAPDFVTTALSEVPPAKIRGLFEKLGVLTMEENEGKVYPRCEQATAVLDALRWALEKENIEITVNAFVTQVQPLHDGFRILFREGKSETVDAVIVATGGMAAPQFGGGVSGYEMLEALGHQRTKLMPALVQVKTDTTLVKSLKGMKIQGSAAVLANGRVKKRENGEILFTEYGLSGPPLFSLSRAVNEANGQEVFISLDIFPKWPEGKVLASLKERRANHGERTLENFLAGMVQKRLGQVLLKASGILPLSRRAETLTDEELEALTRTFKDWRILAGGTLSWRQAQVTAGGIRTRDFDPMTLASKKVPHLYATGEVLDIDGDCGGYNLQWAWASGLLAGQAAVKELYTL